jgi:hypothetical protein
MVHRIEDITVERQEAFAWHKDLGAFVDIPLPKTAIDLG